MELGVLIVMVVLLIPLSAIILDSEIGKALASRIAGGTSEKGAPELDARLERLEGEVRRLSDSLERVSEETEFLRSLAEGRRGDRSRALDEGETPGG